MNCKMARSLFSARVDDELSPTEAGSLAMHIRDCTGGCRDQWAVFEATVRMLHTLPEIEPDPSFVGHVLDRVRAWEAQEAGRPVRAPVRVPWSTSVRSRGLVERLRAWFRVGDPIRLGEWLHCFAGGLAGGIAGSRVLVPVRVTAAVALGVVGGLAIGQHALLSNRAAPFPGLAGLTIASTPMVSVGRSGQIQSTTTAARPFGDLAGDIPPVRAARDGADSIRVQPDDVGGDPATYPGGIGSRQVVAKPGDARPRVTITDGRPQLTF